MINAHKQSNRENVASPPDSRFCLLSTVRFECTSRCEVACFDGNQQGFEWLSKLTVPSRLKRQNQVAVETFQHGHGRSTHNNCETRWVVRRSGGEVALKASLRRRDTSTAEIAV